MNVGVQCDRIPFDYYTAFLVQVDPSPVRALQRALTDHYKDEIGVIDKRKNLASYLGVGIRRGGMHAGMVSESFPPTDKNAK